MASAGPVGPPSEVGPAEKHRPIGGGLCSAVRWWSSTYTSTSCTVLSPSLFPPGTGRNTWLTHLHQDSHQSESCLCSPQMTIGDGESFLPFYNYPQSRSFLHLQSNLDAICRNLFLIFVNFHCLLYLTVASHNHVVISNFT